ncbi:hypothetical protein OESDEN_12014 [Oesophagostomum dentatum]|uniref:Uncharacterized protein n=1 Tax=Oesophagostomum dentatum TaxID=61180 RepID=A0A0B1SYG2_OESDE|nr:hypothetical protein OESDEN_12014 [Oesophagostomum dentatum]
MRRGGGALHHGVSVPTSLGLAFPACVTEALLQVSKHIRLSSHGRGRPSLTKNNDLQLLIDNEIFCLAADRKTSRLSQLQEFTLINLLAHFFTYEFLLPLETSCPEFTVFFVVYATRFMPINRPMAAVFASYINRNPGYFLKGFRDSPHLADIFRQETPSEQYPSEPYKPGKSDLLSFIGAGLGVALTVLAVTFYNDIFGILSPEKHSKKPAVTSKATKVSSEAVAEEAAEAESKSGSEEGTSSEAETSPSTEEKTAPAHVSDVQEEVSETSSERLPKDTKTHEEEAAKETSTGEVHEEACCHEHEQEQQQQKQHHPEETAKPTTSSKDDTSEQHPATTTSDEKKTDDKAKKEEVDS